MNGMKLAAILLVGIGSVGLIALYAFMRYRMEQARRRWEGDE